MTYNYEEDIKQFEKKHPNTKYIWNGIKYKINGKENERTY